MSNTKHVLQFGA